jgi:hypothetical protein
MAKAACGKSKAACGKAKGKSQKAKGKRLFGSKTLFGFLKSSTDLLPFDFV